MVSAKKSEKKKRVVLAYSGGLDTSVVLKWLQEEKGMDVVTLTVDLGQPGDLDEAKKKALETGAIAVEVIDAREIFAEEFILPALKANAMYQGKYPLFTALARPLIAKLLVDTAHKYEAAAVAHGCTGKGNDQVRFDVATASLDPELEVIAPMRERAWTRDEEIQYAREHGVQIEVTGESPYSVDENMWGRSCECGILENPWEEPPSDAYEWVNSPEEAPTDPKYIEIKFLEGRPVSVDGEEMELMNLIEELNKRGGEHGVGRIDMIEDRVVGIKSREIYEAPAALILLDAHKDLESLVLTRDVMEEKTSLENKYAWLVYSGLWYSPLREAIDAFNDSLQKRLTGEARVKLYKGSVNVVGRRSPYSLYDLGLATYDTGDTFSHEASRGFIEIWGLPSRTWSRKSKGTKQKED